MRNWKTLLKPSSKEKHDRQQEAASAPMGDKYVCFSAENFRNQDKLIRFYTGIVNWNVFLKLIFNFNEDLPSLLKLQELDYAIEEIKDDLNHREEQMSI